MKKMLMMVVIIAISKQISYAQYFSLALSAGTSFGTMRSAFDGQKEQMKFHTGFTAGISADIGFGKNVGIQPALNLVQKGGKETYNSPGGDSKILVTINYLEIPINFIYKTGGQNTRFYFGTGPSFAYGISGKTKMTDQGVTLSNPLKLGNKDTDHYKPMEIGANFIMGLLFKNGIQISGNYNIGLNNLSTEKGYNEKNSYFGIRAGYILKNKRQSTENAHPSPAL